MGWGRWLQSISFRLTELGQDGRAWLSDRKDSGDPQKMHQGAGQQSDRVKSEAPCRVRLKSAVWLWYSWTMDNAQWQELYLFRKSLEQSMEQSTDSTVAT